MRVRHGTNRSTFWQKAVYARPLLVIPDQKGDVRTLSRLRHQIGKSVADSTAVSGKIDEGKSDSPLQGLEGAPGGLTVGLRGKVEDNIGGIDHILQ